MPLKTKIRWAECPEEVPRWTQEYIMALTAKQKKLPKALQQAILKRMKKKGKKKKGNAFKLWLHEQYPHLNEQEIEVWFSMFTKEQAKDMLEQYQVKDKDVITGANDL